MLERGAEPGQRVEQVRGEDDSAVHRRLAERRRQSHHEAGVGERRVAGRDQPHRRSLVPDRRRGDDEVAVLDPLQQPQLVVPGGVWQGATSAGAWTLVGYDDGSAVPDEDVELADREELCRGWPASADRITELTRS
ncbi:MAG: hypothetical protein M3500_07155 [Actinomycetota bacterium]|nr:hypothetical protein [Actinomycetota bacterium]